MSPAIRTVAFAIAFLIGGNVLLAGDSESFTEPYRTIKVSASDQGVIEKLLVKEGDEVHKGQVLALLDMEVLEASRDIAKANMESVGKIDSTAAQVELRKERLKKLKELASDDSATPEEVLRAKTELSVAEADYLAAKEEQRLKKLEYARITAQIERRKIVSPIDGFVTTISKEISEFVSATDPVVMTVVQCDQLKAVFPISSTDAERFTPGEKIPVNIEGIAETVEGVVDTVSKVTDPESNSVRMKIVIANPQGRYRSGTACSLALAPVSHDTSEELSPVKKLKKETPPSHTSSKQAP